MKVVILGGNECMERQYRDLCEEHCLIKFLKTLSARFEDAERM